MTILLYMLHIMNNEDIKVNSMTHIDQSNDLQIKGHNPIKIEHIKET